MLQRPHHPSLWRTYIGSRYAILFYVLLLTLLAMPLIVTLRLPPWVIKIPVAACLLAAVMPNATRRTRVILLLAVLMVAGAATAAEQGRLHVNSGSLTAALGLIGIAATAGTVRFTVTSKRVDSETVYAALSTYLLAGIFFGQLYWALERLVPGSIVGPDPLTEQSASYYSFVTLATLGYGDFLPRNDLARGIATFEVIGAQLYLAVMVARLISLFVPSAPQR